MKKRNAVNLSRSDLSHLNQTWKQDPDLLSEDSPLDLSIEKPVNPKTYQVDETPDRRVRSKNYGL